MKNYTIAVAGTGYVGLSIATLLSQHHQVTAVDVEPEEAAHKKGWHLLCADGYPIGFGKLVNQILKNKYPAGWRI